MALTAALMMIGATMSPSLPIQEPALTTLFDIVGTGPEVERPPSAGLPVAEPPGEPAGDISKLTLSSPPAQRPHALVPLYTSLAVLQVFDGYTTAAAVSRGAREANPAMQPLAGKALATAAAKAIATASTIYFAERAWKRNRKGAVILMTAINVASAAVVAHNARVARRE